MTLSTTPLSFVRLSSCSLYLSLSFDVEEFSEPNSTMFNISLAQNCVPNISLDSIVAYDLSKMFNISFSFHDQLVLFSLYSIFILFD